MSNSQHNISNTPEIQTTCLILRRVSENDVDALFNIINDEDVNTFLPLFPFETKAEATHYFTRKIFKDL